MSFNFVNESPEFPYTVTVRPAPADTSEVTVYKQQIGGEEIQTDTLQTEGSGVYTLSLSGRTMEDSPIWLKFVFEKLDPETNDVAGHDEVELAVPLAEPVPGSLEAPPDAICGDTLQVQVSGWGAQAYDGGDEDPNYFPPGPTGPSDDRIPSDAKSGVKWKLTTIEGTGDSATSTTEDLSDTGECLSFSVTDDHAGKTLEFEAYTGDTAPGHAKAQVAVPKVELKLRAEDGTLSDPPAELMLGEEATLQVVVTPPVEGTIAWETDPADQSDLELTPSDDTLQAVLKGLQASKDDAKPKLKPKLTSAATSKETVAEDHELAITPRILEFWYQRSPGAASGNDRGVTGLDFKVSHPDGTELETGTTGDDGKIELKYAGDGTKLEILFSGSPVAEYTVNRRDADMEAVSGLGGQQRRLRLLGYPIGHGGDDQVGVDASMGERTDRAILSFQADKNRNFTGGANGGTRTALTTDAGA